MGIANYPLDDYINLQAEVDQLRERWIDEHNLADRLAEALQRHREPYGVDWEGCTEFCAEDEAVLIDWQEARREM